jgi:hypothetical protein
MAWNEGYHIKPFNPRTLNDRLEDWKGTLTTEQSQMWIAKFCQANPYFAIRLLTGIEIAPIQDMIIRALMRKDFSLLIAGRGFSKSYIICLFVVLYAIFYPGSRIGICSGTFRQSKLIFKQIEKFFASDKGIFLRQCVNPKVSHNTDAWEMIIGTSYVTATPLGGGDRIRGYRFNVMVIDELMLLTGDVVNTVIKPFLSVKLDGQDREKVEMAEDILIREGKLDPKDRTVFQNNKLIGLSSASFKFESLYKDNYVPYINAITDEKAENVNHCVFRLSHRCAPSWLLDPKLIEESKRTMSDYQFKREFEAIFTDDSGGYYSARKIEEATAPVGFEPFIKVKGDPFKKYILAIDPNNNDAEHSDHFAMAVLELDEKNRSGALVHAYALSKSGISARGYYLKYLLNNFNIVYLIVDGAGGEQFLRETEELKLLPRQLNKIPCEYMISDNYEQGLSEARTIYHADPSNILHVQYFAMGGWIRRANEVLQANIENKRIQFGSKITPVDMFDQAKKEVIPIDELVYTHLDDISAGDTYEGKMAAFIDHLESMIDLTKKELTLVEPREGPSGNQIFDLPQNLKRDRSPTRARKDSYTVLLMASWAMQCYFEIKKEQQSSVNIWMPTWAV